MFPLRIGLKFCSIFIYSLVCIDIFDIDDLNIVLYFIDVILRRARTKLLCGFKFQNILVISYIR